MKLAKPTWPLAFVVAVAISLTLFHLAKADTLKGFEGTLVAVNLGVAVFAINFSFVGYQLSAYRHFYRGVSNNQTAASLGVLVLGTAAYIVLGFSPRSAPLIALSVLPALTCSSVALLALARRETNGEVVLARMVSSEKVTAYLEEFADKASQDEEALKKISLSKPQDMPTHEWDWQLSPQTDTEDPFDVLAAIGAVAVKNDDLRTFEACVETGLRRLDQAVAYGMKHHGESFGILHRARAHAEQSIRRLWISVREGDKGGAFARKLQDLLARYVITKADVSKQCSDEVFFALELMGNVAVRALNEGAMSLVLAPVVVARQIVQKGVDDPPTTDKPINEKPIEELMFRHELSQLTNVIKRVGHEAIQIKDTDVLYRCLDAFGWLGCSAMKKNNHEVGRACLRAICQLGRESRAAKLECFWFRCALEPWQHAEERIGWILTWLFHSPKESHEKWLCSIAEAYSRLHGFKVTIKAEQEKGEPKFQTILSKESHTWGYSSCEGHRTIDYADFTFLKDWELH